MTYLPTRLMLTMEELLAPPSDEWTVKVLCCYGYCQNVACTIGDSHQTEWSGSGYRARPPLPLCVEHVPYDRLSGVVMVEARVAPTVARPTFSTIRVKVCPGCDHIHNMEDDYLEQMEAALCGECSSIYRYDDPGGTMECPACTQTLHLCPKCDAWIEPQGPLRATQCNECEEWADDDDWNEEATSGFMCLGCRKVYLEEDDRDEHECEMSGLRR